MRIGIILETKEYEKAWNAFRFAVTAYLFKSKIESINNRGYPFLLISSNPL
jgi:hypothetical protein